MISISKIALACAALVAASGALAQKAGDNIVSLGVAAIHPDASLGKTTSTSSDAYTAAAFNTSLTNASAHVGSTTTMSLSWLHMYSDNIGAEVTIGLPPGFTQDLNTPSGTAKTHPAAAKMKILTPAVVAKYFFGTAQDQWRPYLGLGVTHVSFRNVETNAGDPTVQALAGTSASFSSSWAPVYNAGVIFNIDDKWSVNGSVAYMPVKTTATFSGPGSAAFPNGANPVTTTGDVKLNTTDYVIRVGYRF